MLTLLIAVACYGTCLGNFGHAAPQTKVIDRHFANTLDDYFHDRTEFLQSETKEYLGAVTRLETEDEKRVNEILMKYKTKEYQEGLFDGGKYFGASAHFFHTKPLIEASNVFRLIRTLPKGGALHIHETSAADAWFIVRNFTGSDDLYYCSEGDEFQFFGAQMQKPKCGKDKDEKSVWVQVNRMRGNASSNELFDQWLFEKFSLVVPNPKEVYADINTVWKHFEAKVRSTSGIIKNVESRERFLLGALQEFYDDNVMYVEFRSGLSSMYKKNDGKKISPNEAAASALEVVNKFKKSHPKFWGAKYIFTTHRFKEPEAIVEPLQKAVELMKEFPDFIVGFDLVGQEDKGNPLKLYVPQLHSAKKNSDIKYYFHAGETDWRGSKIDDNLLDAILLNTSRFGHGFSLPGRPQLMDIVEQRQTGVELCPISNQVLGLVEDFRNHPASQLLRVGFPIVVSSDDPGVWGASGLSHDWYIAFMALAGERDDLRFLKQLAINSIKLSAMNKEEKAAALNAWKQDWNNAMRRILDWARTRTGNDFPKLRRRKRMTMTTKP